MDTEINIKEEVPVLDKASHSEKEFSKDVATKKEREGSTKHVEKQTGIEAVACSSDCEMTVKTETEGQTLGSSFGSQNEKEFPTEDPMEVNEYHSDHEMYNEVEIKEEPFSLETETSPVCENIKDGDFSPMKSPRLHRKAVPDGNDTSPFASAEDSEKDGKCYPKCESQESDITGLAIEKQSVKRKRVKKTCKRPKNVIPGNKRQNKCCICERSFSNFANLKRHEVIHCSEKPHKCDICGKKFTDTSHLKRHTFIHGGNKPHKCHICDKSFIQLSSLKLHILNHEGQRPHKCYLCEKSYAQLSHLKVHILIHEGKRPHECEICQKRFFRISHLKRHNLIHQRHKANRV